MNLQKLDVKLLPKKNIQLNVLNVIRIIKCLKHNENSS